MDRNHGAGFSFVADAQAFEQFGNGGMMARLDDAGRNFVKRNEYESALGEPGVRKLEFRFTEAEISHHQDI